MPGLRLAIPAVALWLCCGIGVGVSALMPAAALFAAGLAVVALIVAARTARLPPRGRFLSARGFAAVAVALAAAALGASAVAAQAPQRTDPVLAAAAEQHRRVDTAVRVESAPHRAAAGLDGAERWRLRGTTVSLEAHEADQQVGAGVPVSVVVPGDARISVRAFALGAVIRARVSVLPNEPGEATTFTLRSSAAPDLRSGPPPWLAWAAPVRDAFARAAAGTPGDGGGLLPGLAIGDETAVGPDLDQAMKTSALSHLTAVSGANCALVTGLVFLLARTAGLGRRTRILAAAAALAAFVALVGPGASVLRAAAMAAVVLLALARGRMADGLPALALAVIVLLVHDPWLARDYGFALSALATAGLLLLARPLAAALGRVLPRGIALALAVPLAAQLACQPVLILLTPTLPLFGVPANLVAEPAAPVATVLGCVACLLLPWAPALGQLVVWLAWLPSAWIAGVARFSAGLPGAALPWPDGLVGVALCALVLIAVTVVACRRRLPRAAASTATIALAGGATIYAGALGGLQVGVAIGRPADWLIAACDVGPGRRPGGPRRRPRRGHRRRPPPAAAGRLPGHAGHPGARLGAPHALRHRPRRRRGRGARAHLPRDRRPTGPGGRPAAARTPPGGRSQRRDREGGHVGRARRHELEHRVAARPRAGAPSTHREPGKPGRAHRGSCARRALPRRPRRARAGRPAGVGRRAAGRRGQDGPPRFRRPERTALSRPPRAARPRLGGP